MRQLQLRKQRPIFAEHFQLILSAACAFATPPVRITSTITVLRVAVFVPIVKLAIAASLRFRRNTYFFGALPNFGKQAPHFASFGAQNRQKGCCSFLAKYT
jgi:hypothetical protein